MGSLISSRAFFRLPYPSATCVHCKCSSINTQIFIYICMCGAIHERVDPFVRFCCWCHGARSFGFQKLTQPQIYGFNSIPDIHTRDPFLTLWLLHVSHSLSDSLYDRSPRRMEIAILIPCAYGISVRLFSRITIASVISCSADGCLRVSDLHVAHIPPLFRGHGIVFSGILFSIYIQHTHSCPQCPSGVVGNLPVILISKLSYKSTVRFAESLLDRQYLFDHTMQ